jgi:hypothetical protein
MRNGATTTHAAVVARRLALPLALLAAPSVCAAAPAAASPEPPASVAPSEAAVRAARELFRQAMSAQDRGEHADALAKLRRVADVRATPTVLFYIAYNEEKLGQLLVALGHMTEANKGLEAAAADKRAAQNADAVKLLPFARTELAQLDARVPHLRLAIVPPADASAASVTVDGAPVPAEAWGHLAVVAGAHQVVVQEAGYLEAHAAATARDSATVDVPVTRTKIAPAAPPVATFAAAATPGEGSDGSASDSGGAARHGRGAAIATTVGAVALVGGGIASFLVAGRDASTARSDCAGATSCSPPRGAIRTFDALALGGWIGGAGLAALSVVLWTRPSSSSSSAAPAAATLSLGPGSSSFTVKF